MGQIVHYNEVTSNELAFKDLMDQAGFSVEPVKENLYLENSGLYSKLPVSKVQKSQMLALLQQVPLASVAGEMPNLYRVSFPEGLPNTLTALNQGGYGSMIRIDGKFAGSASFYPVAAQAAALGAFTVMSAATGQYFLSEINSKLRLVNRKLDDILEFLYGDKKAELFSEISFVQYANRNFQSIFLHEEQRQATIAGLQQARKVAIQDLEFYMNDICLSGVEAVKSIDEVLTLKDKVIRSKGCIELSQQLYAIATTLEICYAQNFDPDYIAYISEELNVYINRGNTEISNALSSLQTYLSNVRVRGSQIDIRGKALAEVSELIEPFRTGVDSPVKTAFHETLRSMRRQAEYYIDQNGDVYKKRIA